MAAHPALPQPGDLIGSKYRIQRRLGAGGMGAVFEATHSVTGRRFAIKWLLPDAASDGDAVERFMREARFAGGLEHPNVVDVYDVCEEQGTAFLVMELLEGESLAERITRVERFSPSETLRILLPCMRGVARAHAAGIVHRDLKPANLFICAATRELPERFKVLDFGISKIVTMPGDRMPNSLTDSGTMMGTPYYMAPEQMRGRLVDHRADVYSFGVIMYQMLSGRLPFTASTFGDLVLQVLTEPPARLTDVAPDVPPELAEVVEHAMARRAEERFESVAALITALEQSAKDRPAAEAMQRAIEPQPSAADAAPLAAPTPLSTESKARPPKRGLRPLWIAAIASACLTGLGLLAYWFSADRETGAAARPQHIVQPRPEPNETTINAASETDPAPSVWPLPPPAVVPAEFEPLPPPPIEPAEPPPKAAKAIRRPIEKPAPAPAPSTAPAPSPPREVAPEKAKPPRSPRDVKIVLDSKQF